MCSILGEDEGIEAGPTESGEVFIIATVPVDSEEAISNADLDLRIIALGTQHDDSTTIERTSCSQAYPKGQSFSTHIPFVCPELFNAGSS